MSCLTQTNGHTYSGGLGFPATISHIFIKWILQRSYPPAAQLLQLRDFGLHNYLRSCDGTKAVGFLVFKWGSSRTRT